MMTETSRSDSIIQRPGLSALGAAFTLFMLAGMDIYNVMVMLYLVLSWLTGDALWPVMFIGTFLPWVLLLAFLILPVLFIARRWVRVVMTAPAIIAFVVIFGGLFLPRTAPAPACVESNCREITVMTYNVGSGVIGPGVLVEMLRASEADVIMLQEVVAPQAEAMDAALQEEYPYRVFYPAIVEGKGVLSRYPIVEDSGPVRFETMRTHQRVVLDVEGQQLTVVNAHPDRPFFRNGALRYPPGTAAAFPRLVDMAHNGSGPGIMVGDFNTTARSDMYSVLVRAGLRDAWQEAGQGFGMTFPAGLRLPPLVRLDMIWLTDGLAVQEVWVGPDGGSDHMPLTAVIVWPADERAAGQDYLHGASKE